MWDITVVGEEAVIEWRSDRWMQRPTHKQGSQHEVD